MSVTVQEIEEFLYFHLHSPKGAHPCCTLSPQPPPRVE